MFKPDTRGSCSVYTSNCELPFLRRFDIAAHYRDRLAPKCSNKLPTAFLFWFNPHLNHRQKDGKHLCPQEVFVQFSHGGYNLFSGAIRLSLGNHHSSVHEDRRRLEGK